MQGEIFTGVFSEAEAIYFSNIVKHQIEASKQRKEKKVREKKPRAAKMKRSELLSRLLAFMESVQRGLDRNEWTDREATLLLEELRKVVNGKRKALPGDGGRG